MAVMRLQIAQQFVAEVESPLIAVMFLVAFHFGCCHEAVRLFVLHHIDIVALAFHHALFLLAERTKEVFHQSPIQESAILVRPGALKPCKFADLDQRAQGCGNEFLVLVEVDEDFNCITDGKTIGNITRRQEYFAIITTIEVDYLMFGRSVCTTTWAFKRCPPGKEPDIPG